MFFVPNHLIFTTKGLIVAVKMSQHICKWKDQIWRVCFTSYVFKAGITFFKLGFHQQCNHKHKQHMQSHMHFAHWYLLLEQKNHVTKPVYVACVYACTAGE